MAINASQGAWLPETKYPWQKPCAEAALEFDPAQVSVRIAAAEQSIENRIMEIAGGYCNPEEASAIRDAKAMMRMLRRTIQPER